MHSFVTFFLPFHLLLPPLFPPVRYIWIFRKGREGCKYKMKFFGVFSEYIHAYTLCVSLCSCIWIVSQKLHSGMYAGADTSLRIFVNIRVVRKMICISWVVHVSCACELCMWVVHVSCACELCARVNQIICGFYQQKDILTYICMCEMKWMCIVWPLKIKKRSVWLLKKKCVMCGHQKSK